MARYEDFFGFFHLGSDTCGLAFSFLRRCAILSSWEKPERGWESRKLTSCLSAGKFFPAKKAGGVRGPAAAGGGPRITSPPPRKNFATRPGPAATRFPGGGDKKRL